MRPTKPVTSAEPRRRRAARAPAPATHESGRASSSITTRRAASIRPRSSAGRSTGVQMAKKKTAAQREKKNERERQRYAEDPKYRERKLASKRARHALHRDEVNAKRRHDSTLNCDEVNAK